VTFADAARKAAQNRSRSYLLYHNYPITVRSEALYRGPAPQWFGDRWSDQYPVARIAMISKRQTA